jgi:hypothetical protein
MLGGRRPTPRGLHLAKAGWLVVAAAAALVVIVGCRSHGPNLGVGTSPGLVNAFDDGRLLYVLIVDYDAGMRMGGSGFQPTSRTSHSFRSADGREFHAAYTHKNRLMRIEGRNYPLADGRVFLCRAEGGDGLEVRQLDIPLTTLRFPGSADKGPDQSYSIIDETGWILSDPRVQDFFWPATHAGLNAVALEGEALSYAPDVGSTGWWVTNPNDHALTVRAAFYNGVVRARFGRFDKERGMHVPLENQGPITLKKAEGLYLFQHSPDAIDFIGEPEFMDLVSDRGLFRWRGFHWGEGVGHYVPR